VLALTLLQSARPTSFGLVASGWMTAIDETCAALREVPWRCRWEGRRATGILRWRLGWQVLWGLLSR
jgi:hypothetical protein